MSASRMVVRDGRQAPSVCMAKDDLAVIGERCEPRRLSPVRSVYLALQEVAGEPDGWTRKALAARAGVGTGLLRDALGVLEALGLLRSLADGSCQLASPGCQGEVPLPVPEEAPEVLPAPPPEDPRAAQFFAWHARQVESIRGGRPSRDPRALAAAARILAREPSSAAIKARLDFALGERFYADKVLKLSDFDRWWPRINAAYLADERRKAQTDGLRREVAPPTGVSYEGERVSFSSTGERVGVVQ